MERLEEPKIPIGGASERMKFAVKCWRSVLMSLPETQGNLVLVGYMQTRQCISSKVEASP